VLQWTLAYAAAAYTLLHATQMAAESFDWPHFIVRIAAVVLILGVPIVALLAWYHGHKAQHRFSTAELTLLTVLLIIAGSILWAMTRASVTHIAAPTTAAGAPRTSIAVLPFANLTGDASKDYLGDGMAEEVLNTLAKVPGFRVPARTSSFAYKGRSVDVRQIARDLGVGAILEGSVKSAGERIRVTAQLVSAQDGLRIWSDSYDRQFTDIFKLQDELSDAIVQALQGTINPTAATAAARGPGTQDVEAYRLYLQARAADRPTEEGTLQAIALYDHALARDPNFARALAWRAVRRTMAIGLVLYPNALEKSEEDARRALALDLSLPEAHLALAKVATARGRWLEAETDFRIAISAQPPDAESLVMYSNTLLLSSGRLREARTQAAEAYRLAPADPLVARNNAAVNSIMGFDSDAVRFAELALELGIPPSSDPVLAYVRANAAARSGRYGEAAARAAEGTPAPFHEAGGAEAFRLSYIALGDPKKVPEAREALQRLVRSDWSRIDTISRLHLIALFTSLGALDQAYDVANRGLEDFNGGLWAALWRREMGAFRKDSRFQAFVTRLKLMDYWKQYGPPDECDLKGDTLVCR
jgi:TolB-like protein